MVRDRLHKKRQTQLGLAIKLGALAAGLLFRAIAETSGRFGVPTIARRKRMPDCCPADFAGLGIPVFTA